MRTNVRRREEYVGPWLPEPLLLDDHDPSADVVLAESVSTAMLVVLETLSPDERAVFVLREVFGFDYDEIAAAVDKSVGAVRQMAHRAREHVRARRRRFEPVDPQRSVEITTQFLAAAMTGKIDALMALLAPDAAWTADSDGKVSAARRPVLGAEKVAKLVMGLLRAADQRTDVRFETASYNSAPALILYIADKLEGIITVEVIDGKIANFYAMRNPEKLTAVTVPREISR